MEPQKTKKFNIDIDYRLTKDDLENAFVPTASQMTSDYVNYAGYTAFPKGLSGQKLRIWSRIQRKLDSAISHGHKHIDLEQSEIDLLKESFDKATFQAKFAKYATILEEAINSL